MGISESMTGSSWHIEKAVRSEGDPRRYQSRCVHYNKVSRYEDYCDYYLESCHGSGHCGMYEEQEKKERVTEPITSKAQKEQGISLFEAIDIFPRGSRVRHKTKGLGTVKSVEDGKQDSKGNTPVNITILFDDGKEVTFRADTCIKNGLLVKIEK